MIEITIGSAVLALDCKGCAVSLKTREGEELLSPEVPPQPFVQMGVSGELLWPETLTGKADDMAFSFGKGVSVRIRAEQRPEYAAFCVEAISGAAEAVVFGPVFACLAEEIGDIVGVLQGGGWALGIQALNPKTLGGFPAEFRDQVSPLVSGGPVSELSVAPLPYFDCAAYAAAAGETPLGLVQLYCENRCRPRRKEIMSWEEVPVGSMDAGNPDAGIAGAAFALFCCPREKALKTIGRIEAAEGLPHPMLDGCWAKESRESMRSYLIAEFGPGNFRTLLNWARKAGFRSLYHPEPFETWGHFRLREDCFPDGDASLKAYCDAAAKEGMSLGLHTLSAFTTPSDPYVSPVPDARLAVLGSSVLKNGVSAEEEILSAADGSPFRAVTSLQTVRVGNELIRYASEKDGQLEGCQRGAFGTSPAPHKAGETVDLLCDHPYKVFFPNLELQKDYSRRIGTLFRETGAAQISFDGLEGCAAAGEDAYGINRFCLDCWEGWGRPDVINDASRLNHNLWHMHTRMNWGEPWGAKMREGMLEYRIKNQDFYRRNLFPRMLGWFLIRKADRKFEATPPEDIEWALSMAAGFDAGFALSTSAAVLETNGCSEELFEKICSWETLRLAEAFSPELRRQLRDPATEWRLEKAAGGYLLYPLFISKPLVCDLLELQPGQPGGSDWVLVNPFGAQEYELRIRVEGNGQIHDPAFITRKGMLRFSGTVKGSQYLWFRGGKALLTDRNYRPLEEIPVTGRGTVEPGQQAFSFSCSFSGEEGPEVTVRVFTRGEPVFLPEPQTNV